MTNVSNQTNVPNSPSDIVLSEASPLMQQTSAVTLSRRKFLAATGSVGVIGAAIGILGYRAIAPKPLQDIRMIFTQSAVPLDLSPFPLTNALQQQSGLPVSIEFYPKSYADSVTRFASGEFNVLWDSAYAYVIAAARYRVRPILQLKSLIQDSSHYYSHILTKSSSNIHSIVDLKGRSLALVDRYSGSGYLYPLYALHKAGLGETDVRTVYVGTHTQSLESVLSGKADAGAVSEEFYRSADKQYIADVYTNALSKYNLKDDDIVSIYRTDPIPMGPIVVHSDILESDVWRLQSAFLLSDDPALLRSLDISGFGSVTDSVYDPIRKMAHELGIDLADV